MHKATTVSKNNSSRHLQLVTSSMAPSVRAQPFRVGDKVVDHNEINFLTHAMMNRLWIPQSSTIVGLLGVGACQDNFEELSKWINAQLNITNNKCVSNDLPHLERRFRDAVDHYPEI